MKIYNKNKFLGIRIKVQPLRKNSLIVFIPCTRQVPVEVTSPEIGEFQTALILIYF